MAQSLKQAAAQREPWLLAASVSLADYTAAKIVALYRSRMQIEEAFRDLKCLRYGLGFSLNRSRAAERLAVLLLIPALALCALWLIGTQAIARHLQYRYQSNTRRTRPVLSVIQLALQILHSNTDHFSMRELIHTFRSAFSVAHAPPTR